MKNMQRMFSLVLVTILCSGMISQPAQAKSFDRIGAELEVESPPLFDNLGAFLKIDRYELIEVEVDDTNDQYEYLVSFYAKIYLELNTSEYLEIAFEWQGMDVFNSDFKGPEIQNNPFSYSQEMPSENNLIFTLTNEEDDINSIPRQPPKDYAQHFYHSEPAESMEFTFELSYYNASGIIQDTDSANYTIIDINYPANLLETPVSTLWVFMGLAFLSILLKRRR